MTVTLIAALMLGGLATTVTVENAAPGPIELTSARLPSHYPQRPAARVAPGGTDRIASTRGRIILPHDQVDADMVDLSYVDARGNGCRFGFQAVRHTSDWSKLKPWAEPIGRGSCEARTGRTIGDFVYVIR